MLFKTYTKEDYYEDGYVTTPRQDCFVELLVALLGIPSIIAIGLFLINNK